MGKLYDLLNSMIGKLNNTVKTEPQTLTDDQQTTARSNIGAVKSWNDLTDKPVVVEGTPDTLTVGDFDSWAAQFSEDNPPTMDSTGSFVKLSDATPALEDLTNGIIITYPNGESGTVTYYQVLQSCYVYGVVANEAFAVIPVDNHVLDDVSTFPEKGFYLSLNYIECSITIPGYTGFGTEKIAPSHLYQPDWNQNDETQPDFVKNRTHWEETVETGGDTLTWDGNTEGLVHLNVSYHKVSDNVPTKADFSSGVSADIGVEKVEMGADIQEGFTDDGFLFATYFIIVPYDGYESDGDTFPEKGVYLFAYEDEYVSSLTIPGYTGFVTTETVVHPLDTKFLPEHLQFGESETGGDTLEWDGNTEGLTIVDDAFVLLSNATPTADEIGENSTIDFGEGAITLTIESAADVGLGDLDGVYVLCGAEIGMVAILTEIKNAEVVESVLPQTGIWIPSYLTEEISSLTITIPGYTGFPLTKKMDEKYLPTIPAEKLPGAVVLYTDAENYLYATEDTSDTTKRMTRAELQSVAVGNSHAYICVTNEEYTLYITPTQFAFCNEPSIGAVSVVIGSTVSSYYTAEYTAT